MEETDLLENADKLRSFYSFVSYIKYVWVGGLVSTSSVKHEATYSCEYCVEMPSYVQLRESDSLSDY
jgi:hypothetical protein